jgi:hydroxymethylbilane synthase
MRGNVETRLRKLAAGEVDAIVLALAGLKRLGLADAATAVLSIDEFLPAVGQGIIAIEARGNDEHTLDLVRAVSHPATAAALTAERAFLAVLEGSCRTPIAGHAAVAEVLEAQRHGAAVVAVRLGAEAGRELKLRAGADFFAAV